MVGEVVGVEKVPIEFTVTEGKGIFKLGDAVSAEMAPLEGATGATTLSDSAFSSIPGSPAYVGTATHYKAEVPAIGFSLDLSDHNSVQGSFHFVS